MKKMWNLSKKIFRGVSFGYASYISKVKRLDDTCQMNGLVTEASVMAYLRRHFFRLMAHAPFLSVTRFISERHPLPRILLILSLLNLFYFSLSSNY